jgi:muramoyltetrapeptide carboxypeptidase
LPDPEKTEQPVRLAELPRPTLKNGSRVAIVSPASAARRERVAAGVEALQRFGYKPVVMPHALARGPLYYAGSAEERAADLMAAFADPTINGVICTRGGWGSAELLPLLDPRLIQANRKVFVGYSDHSSLHTWFWNECDLPTIYGPMVAADWASEGGADLTTWRSAVDGEATWSVGAQDGLRVLRPGEAEGRLLGGCLAILAASLGTPWAFRADEPLVLFLEDIGVKPYQWDRMLQHLYFAGVMANVRAVIFGDMTACAESAEQDQIAEACLLGLRHFAGPVSIGLRCGHVQGGNRSLPLGAWVRVSADRVIEIGEPFV